MIGRMLSGALLCVLCAGGHAQNPATLWYDAGHVTLTVSGAADGFAATWQFDRADNGDVRIVKDERRGAARIQGTVISVCGDSALLMKDIVPLPRHELQELDEPVLHLQLLLRLLARGLPQGPLALGAETAVDAGDTKTPVRTRKGYSARRDFGAPWRVRGKVTRGAGAEINYELVFSYTTGATPERRAELRLAGAWRQQSGLRALDNGFALADWKVYRIDAVPVVVGGNTQFDSVAAGRPLPFATLGELRARIERVWDAGPRAHKEAECKL